GICNNSMGYENLIVIVLAAGMLLFGSKKLQDLFGSFGRAKSESEKAKLEARRELGRIQCHLGGGDTSRKSLEEISLKLDTLNPGSLSDKELTQSIQRTISAGSGRREGQL
ncbi:MAG: twin-arginine translocase TatA/TatE family subunit, partial [Candidatus Nitrosopolaris sp.]